MSPAAVDLFHFENLAALDGVVHGISGRAGGVSDGRFATLNVSYTVGDEQAHVDENLRRIAGALGTARERLFAAYQVHGSRAVVVDQDTPSRPECDVLVTRSNERALMLRFADCTPVLLADPARQAVGAAHAGWRGTAAHAARSAVTAMQEAFGSRPGDLVVGIGPSIGPCCYEVGRDVADAFVDRPWALAAAAPGRYHLDLWEANRRALVSAGVPEEQIEVAGICTRCQADRFFSHRANGGEPAGRFAGVIGLSASR